MTAPALPGAAPDPAPGRNDPARLPPEVEKALSLALSDAPARGTCDELLLRTAIARALGGDGEPVAESVDAALADLDVEHYVTDEGWRSTILGLDAVRAAHRAEVERAVAEKEEAEGANILNRNAARALSARVAKLEAALREVSRTASAHHAHEDSAVLLHALLVEIPELARAALEEPK